MKAPARPHDENQRINALRTLRVLDTPVEERFERITRLAQKFFGVTIAAITLVDDERQWFKSIKGLDVRETERRVSFCGHALLEDALFVVEDTLEDDRFTDNPLVTGPPHIRFYAGVPLRARNRQPIGTFCIIDNRPHKADDIDVVALHDLAVLAEREFTFASPTNQQSTPAVHGGPKENQLDEVTGLWNWDGIVRQLEESNQRIKMIGGEITLAWLRIDLNQQDLDAETVNNGRRIWGERLLSALEFFDTAGVVSERDFLLLINESDRAQLMIRLGLVANHLNSRQGDTPGVLLPAHLSFAAIKSIDGRMGSADILDLLENALPATSTPSGTLTLIDGNQRSRISLL